MVTTGGASEPVGPPPGWYEHEGTTQWWDGTKWTGHRQPKAEHSGIGDPRRAALDRALEFAATRGGVVESRTDYQAFVAYGHPANHVMHAILSILTFGFWLIVWLFVAASGDRRIHQVITVTEACAVEYNPPIFQMPRAS